MNNTNSTIGMPVEQGIYILTLGILPEEDSPIYFYNREDERANGCQIYGVEIHESITDILPTCRIEAQIPYFWIDNQYLTDGTKISIEMKIDEEIAKDFKKLSENSYIFRLFSVEKIEDYGLSIRVMLNGIIDFLSGYGDGNELNCACTTSNVFKTCADKFGFSNRSIDNTQDKQLWIANGRNIYQFLTHCCQHGYMNDTSAMLWAIDRNKKLYYKNIVNCFNSDKADASCKDGNCGSSTIRVGSLGVPIITSVPFGLNNVTLGGYGIDSDVFQLCEQNSSKYSYKNIKSDSLCKTSESTCLCKNGPKKQGQNWFPFDVGNHNENYFKAVTQNRQILASYSTFLSVRFSPTTAIVVKNSIVPFFEYFHLFDSHNIEYDIEYDQETKSFIHMDALTMKAVVESIDVNITQAHASTNVRFVTQGFNKKGSTN